MCPYYAARSAVPAADVLLVPYSALLVGGAAAALGLRLEGAVVVGDEGHNLGAQWGVGVCGERGGVRGASLGGVCDGSETVRREEFN